MYTLINQRIEYLLANIHEEREVQRYVWLIRNFSTVDVAEDAVYQQKYRQYWQLNAARLSPEFHEAYFALLQDFKSTGNADVETVARRLLDVPSHRNGQRKLHFSFASKLVHMVDHHLPIYDSLVEEFYFLPRDKGSDSTEDKLHRLLESYRFLKAEYARILADGLLNHAIGRFRGRFSLGPEYSDSKVIDTLIWRFVGVLRDGAVRSGNVVYG